MILIGFLTDNPSKSTDQNQKEQTCIHIVGTESVPLILQESNMFRKRQATQQNIHCHFPPCSLRTQSLVGWIARCHRNVQFDSTWSTPQNRAISKKGFRYGCGNPCCSEFTRDSSYFAHNLLRNSCDVGLRCWENGISCDMLWHSNAKCLPKNRLTFKIVTTNDPVVLHLCLPRICENKTAEVTRLKPHRPNQSQILCLYLTMNQHRVTLNKDNHVFQCCRTCPAHLPFLST